MMKKLVVFILVALCTSVANATLSLTLSPTHDYHGVTIDGVIDTDLYIVVVSDVGVLSPLGDSAILPPGRYIGPASDFEGLGWFPSGWDGGVWLAFDIGGHVGSYMSLDVTYTDYAQVYSAWYNEATDEIGLIGEITVPEPATIALLWLGGLSILRRRHK